ncbi:MAG: zf-HC2 domain-containing protein, partial [Actinomycetota bacterium]
MDHSEARMLASARSDGELEPDRFAELDAHVDGCDACRAFTEALPQLSVLASALPREHAPADLSRRVRAELA